MDHRQLIIMGKPVAKNRPRFARRGKFTVTYSDQQTEEGRFLWEVKQQWTLPPIEGPIELEVEYCMPVPKYLSKKWQLTPHLKKPDINNMLKFLEDCCNGTVWKDDSQIHRITVSKRYSEMPRTVMKIAW